ncbi:hypothetical protein F5Y07DRAFT_387531 [Xylaria sp. FL0933]|nr:hypothetical protein F5Y07DRAFT_387531 [Xylaria sp. FL0933]
MSIASKDVFTGMWADWSKDSQVLGSTITLTSSGSRFLAAFLALYVSLSVSYLWLLVVYSIHRARYSITGGKCRAIVRQQQALLKAGTSPASTSIRLIKLYWAYRFTPFAWHQSWLWITISALSALSSAAAGLFSSQIIDSSLYINVLTNSSNCGFVSPQLTSGGVNDPGVIASNQDLATLVDLASIYARDCYNSTSDKSQCNFFSSSTIPWETEWEAECPFENMCIGPAMRLDTGLLNSNSLLGINSPTADQIGLRKVTTCAPIRQEGFTVIEPESDGSNDVSYLYGPIQGDNATRTLNTYQANITFAYDMVLSYYSGGPLESDTWFPIRAMNNTHGDGSIIFLSSNNVLFTDPCDDPIFSAHVPQDEAGLTWYVEDHLAGVLGCLEQYQMCSATSSTCSAVGGLSDVLLEVTEKMPLNPTQVSTANVTANVLRVFGSMPKVTSGNVRHLVAGRTFVVDAIQLPLPSNQWQIEVQFWHSTIMSLIQYGLLQYMVGPNDDNLQKYVVPPSTSEEQALCKRQRVRISQGFANVSSLGLFFTISLGSVVILLALLLDNIMGCIARLSKGDGKKHRAWIRDDVLHFQRLAYRQEQAFGPRWIATDDDDVPLVEGNGFLDPLVDPQESKADDSQSRLSVDSLMDVDGTL